MSSASDYIVTPFRPEHFDLLELQDSQAYVRGHTTHERLAELAERGPAFTLFAGDRPLCCGGLRVYDAERGVLWSYVSRHAGTNFRRIHRYTERFIDTLEQRHLQATCRTGFAAGARWLLLLGFRWSRSLGPYGPANVPHELFERVR